MTPLTGPIALVGGQPQPVALALGVGELFWISSGSLAGDGSVKSVSLLGGTPTLIAGSQLPPRDVLALSDSGGTTLLWSVADESNPTGGAIMRRTSAGDVSALVANIAMPEGIAVHGNFLYWTQFAPAGGIFRAPVNGGSAVMLATGNYPTRIMADDRYVYWLNEGTAGASPPDGSIARFDSQTSSLAPIVSAVQTPRGLALAFEGGATQAATLFYSEFHDAGSLVRVSLAGGTLGAPESIATGLSFPSGVAVHADGFVYWANRGNGTIVRLAVSAAAGATPTILAEGQQSPTAIKVDDASVYWLNEGNAGEPNGALMSMAKPQ